MRILRLVDPGNFALEFHPYITVVAGVADDDRDRIVEAFESAALGRTTELRGLIEVHGVVLDLDERALGLLELEDGEIETSVLATDLPGNASSGVGRQVRAAERRLEALEQPHRDRLTALGQAEAELEVALAADAAAQDARSSAEMPAAPVDDPSAVDRAALEQRRAELQHERDRLVAALDPGAADALEAAEAALGRADREAEPSGHDDGASLAELRSALALHRLYDPAPVRDALDEVRATHGTGETVPSTEALNLVDRLDDLDRQIAALDAETDDEPTPAMVEAAKERVEQARLALAESERQSASRSSDADHVAALEEAHAEVELARDALDGRFGRAKAQRRLDDARAAEDELLERLGLHSYTDYLTRGGALGSSSGSSGELDAARAAVEAAESEAAALDRNLDASLSQAELVEERRRARDQARALLGRPDLDDEAITVELLEVRVPADVDSPIEGLVEVLDAVGLPVRDLDLGPDEIEALAADWLTEHQHSESRLLRSIEAHEADADPADGLGVVRDPVLGGDPPIRAEPLADDPVAAARDAVEVARARSEAHETVASELAEVESALLDVDAASAAFEPPGDDVDDVDDPDESQTDAPDATIETAQSVAAARAAVEEATLAVDAGRTEYESAVEELAVLRQTVSELDEEPPPVNEIEWYLLARLAAQRQQSFVGSLPLVVAGALDGVTDDEGLEHLLDRLERMAGAVQIVHITDDPRIIGWADALAEDRAAVVRPVASRADAV